MSDRRNFLKASLAVGATSALSACSMVQKADAQASNSSAASAVNFPQGVIYTRENPGKWAKKVGGHAPVVEVVGNQVTITTNHGMSSKHYIVRHTIVTQDGEVLASKTFTPDDDEPISSFDISVTDETLYATSFCNKHDFWLTTFTV